MNRLKTSIGILLLCMVNLAQAENSRKAVAFTSTGGGSLLDLESRTILGEFGEWAKRNSLLNDALVVVDAHGNGNIYVVADRILHCLSIENNSLQDELTQKGQKELAEKEYILDSIFYDQKRQVLAGALRLKYSIVADLPDGQGKARSLSEGKWTPSKIEDYVFSQTNGDLNLVPGRFRDLNQMKELFPKHADYIPEKNRMPWVLVGQSPRLSTYYLFRESEGLTENYTIIVDRQEKTSRLYHFKPSGLLYTYDDTVFFEEEVTYYDPDTRMYTQSVYSGNDRVCFSEKPEWVPCKVEKYMRHLYVYGGKAYFKKGVDVYSVDISPSGCGAPEKVLTLPFEPERFFVFESPKPSKPGIPLPESASEVEELK